MAATEIELRGSHPSYIIINRKPSPTELRQDNSLVRNLKGSGKPAAFIGVLKFKHLCVDFQNNHPLPYEIDRSTIVSHTGWN